MASRSVGRDDAPSDQSEASDPDALEHADTPMSRLLSRGRWGIALLLAIAMAVPAGGWLVDELAYRDSGDEVEQELAEEPFLADAVLRVRATDCGGQVSTGSAFALELDGGEVLVTNRHVVQGARTVGVRPLDGGASVRVDRHLVSEIADVAVLELAPDAAERPRALPAATSSTSAGQEVRVIGFPGGRAAVSAGRVAAATETRLDLALEVDPGASGSPVVDEDGSVVGQVFARTADGRGIATPLARVAEAVAAATPEDPC